MRAIDIKMTVNGKTNGKLFDSNDIKEVGKWISKNHYLISKDELKKEQDIGFDKKPRIRTDNKWGKPTTNVLPFGKIEYFARSDVSEVIMYAYKMIEDRSPRGATWRFQSSNWVYYQNTVVAKNRIFLKTWLESVKLKDQSKITFVNVTPYASRLEYAGIKKGKRGTVGKRRKVNSKALGKSFQRPNGVYFLALGAIRRKYKQAGELIKFTWVGSASGITPPSVYGYRTTYMAGSKRSGPYVYPSIEFTISAKGILE